MCALHLALRSEESTCTASLAGYLERVPERVPERVHEQYYCSLLASEALFARLTLSTLWQIQACYAGCIAGLTVFALWLKLCLSTCLQRGWCSWVCDGAGALSKHLSSNGVLCFWRDKASAAGSASHFGLAASCSAPLAVGCCTIMPTDQAAVALSCFLAPSSYVSADCCGSQFFLSFFLVSTPALSQQCIDDGNFKVLFCHSRQYTCRQGWARPVVTSGWVHLCHVFFQIARAWAGLFSRVVSAVL